MTDGGKAAGDLFCGIDLGTGGARCVFVSPSGDIVSRGECGLEDQRLEGLPPGWFEQDPWNWLTAVKGAVREAASSCESPERLCGIGVTSTSGTVCAVDRWGNPVRHAIMYNDSRSEMEAEQVQRCGQEVARRLGYRFKPSFALPKLLWLREHEPHTMDQTARFVSPSDYLIGWMTGSWNTTDQTNALKYGYDLLEDRWPDFIEDDLDIPLSTLPGVIHSGEEAGKLLSDIAETLGLPAGVPVAAGMTDGCASQVSSGAVTPGDINTTIGTTLVMKAVSEKLLLDPAGRIYCHRHPEGWWLPGGASNTGAKCLQDEFGEAQIAERSRRALEVSPTSLTAYPLTGTGERFPFCSSRAEGFLLGEPSCRDELFAAYLEGVACVERLGIELLATLNADPGETVYSAGGGSASREWLQIRADILGRQVARPAEPGAAMGAAIAAASHRAYDSLSEAARQMVRIETVVEPRQETAEHYGDKFYQFRRECACRGYIGE